MPVIPGTQQQKISCWDRITMGFTMGFCVGMTSGAILTGFAAFRYGLRGRELIGHLGKSMVQGGGTFGVFMAIGMGIRC
ncbi:reactive oxygen species modulator 1 [Vespula pensylvanica]|uniref:Reactive oxygen species modulator 1 n=1 Tax=Vespula pensylvanica TaxID=30213 RepID=A0A834P6X7_VESPE|nr:reactive oxygen species modulator 1 [Vespula pensylvanica]KAF7431274.1 hypothetical protein H0235_004198 [Vespula pensylvanica]